MKNITIPPEVVEAAAIAAMKDNGCGYTINSTHVLCDDPVCEGLIDAYGKPLKHECSCRSMATAALRAGMAAWPMKEIRTRTAWKDGIDIETPTAIILPITEPSNGD
jgi:hypothetical protein